jgi:hypothetical protein
VSAGIWAFILILLIVAVARVRAQRRRGGLGTGAAGVVHDMLNEDKRHAVEIIVTERAAARDPEDRDGNLPDLTNPKR